MGAVGSRQGAMGLQRGSRRARGLQRGAMGVRGLQRGVMGVRGLQRGASAARELQVGAMGPNGFQRNASGARAVLRGPMKKRAEPKHQKAPNFGCFPPAASGAPIMTGRGRGVGGVGMGGSIWGLARGGRAVRAGTPWRRGVASGSTALKRRLGGMTPGHMAAGVRPRVRLESRRLGSGQESQQNLTTSTTSSFRQAVRIRQREARRALLNLRRGLQTQTAVPSLKQKRRPSAKQRNKQMGESSVASSSLLTVSITNPQAPISNKQRSLRPPVLAKPAPTQPKGVPLRYNIRQLSNQTKLTLNERFSTLQRERVQRPGSHAARLVALH
uniref:Forty-two-three domain-containing protein 1 n=1 Tax=Eptatretus burgeri TaxID=7764 RepID=A0A8C4WXR2_EPTBU